VAEPQPTPGGNGFDVDDIRRRLAGEEPRARPSGLMSLGSER
jgi:hypothetical protein